MTRLGFRVWGIPGSGGQVGGVMLVLRTFPELVGRSVQNLVEIGPAVWGVKRVHRYKQSLLYRVRKAKNRLRIY